MAVSLRAMAALLISCLVLSSCVSKKEVKANLWLNNLHVLSKYCEEIPELNDIGLFRRIDSPEGQFELVSVCDPNIKNFYSMHKDVLARMLNGRAKPKKEK